jgi:hypothetical protein
MTPVKKIYIFGNIDHFFQQKYVLEKLNYNVRFNNNLSDINFEDFVKNMIWCDLIIIPQFEPEETILLMLRVVQASSVLFNKEIWVIKNQDKTPLIYDKEKDCLFNSWFEIYSELHP